MDTNPGIKHKNQRVGVFIDVQNMYYSAKALYGRKVNFGEILNAAVADRQLIRALAYVVRATGEEDPFFEALNQRGIETKERELQEFHGGAKKADWDVGITVDAIRIGEVLDAVVIVSGDGDFVELLEYLKHHGKQVEVVAFKQSASARLIEAADNFVDLSADTDRFTIRGSMRGTGRKTTKTTKKEPASKTPDGAEKKKEPAKKLKIPKIPSRAGTKDGSVKSEESSGDSFWIKPVKRTQHRSPKTKK
ncbi:MAG: NYN domain-containing protein [Patescibacteria group bacterium]|nr:NYN domain-containing protein [Patescibacteria group bacterium]